jgi:hypothetical protein
MAKFVNLALGLVAMCVVLTASAARAADETVNVTGTWKLEVDLGGQGGSPTFILKQDGEKLTGKYKGQFGEADVIGKLKGNEIEFGFEAQGAKISYTGTVEKDSMKGKCNYADQASGTFTGKKTSDKTE